MISFDEQSFSFEYSPNYPLGFFWRGGVTFLVFCVQVILYTWKFEGCEWSSSRWTAVLVIANLYFLLSQRHRIA